MERAVALRQASTCLKFCQIRVFKETWKDMAYFVSQRAMSILWEHVEGCRRLCVVMSSTHSRLLDFAVEIATAQLRYGRHFVCITPTNSLLSHTRSLKALRSLRGLHTAIADGCTFGCRCVVTEHLVPAGWQFVTTLATARDVDATKVGRRSCSRAANSGSADACPLATSHCDEPTPNQRQVGHCSVCGSS